MKMAVIFGTIVLLGFTGVYMLTNQNKQEKTADNFLTGTPSPTINFNSPTPLPVVRENERITANSAVIETERGNIEVDLYASQAAKTVTNFATLAKRGFYNNLTFHRVETWVIQGGDPTGTGTGGQSIYGGYFEDEVNPENDLYKQGYVEGILAMANKGPDTNSSQFFIITQNMSLAPNYTIFGKVTKGMEVVKSIQKGDKILRIDVK